MSWNDAALLGSMCVNFIALYGAFRKQRTAAKVADAEADGDIEDGAIGRWQAFALKLEGKVDAQDRAMDAMRARELECAGKTARQEEQIAHLTQAMRSLRADLKRAGIQPGSGGHDTI